MDPALLPGSVTLNHAQSLDEEGQQHLRVQEHAAAVQLMHRSLAVAHLRAEAAKYRGQAVVVTPKPGVLAIKQEVGGQQPRQQPWTQPQQPPATVLALQPIAITISTTQLELEPEAVSEQPQPPAAMRPLRGARRTQYKRPDRDAAAQWLQGEDGMDIEGAVPGAVSGLAKQHAGHLPRIKADPAMQAQQLARWVQPGAEGTANEAAGQPEELEASPAAGTGLVEEGLELPAEEDENSMDEEEWV